MRVVAICVDMCCTLCTSLSLDSTIVVASLVRVCLSVNVRTGVVRLLLVMDHESQIVVCWRLFAYVCCHSRLGSAALMSLIRLL